MKRERQVRLIFGTISGFQIKLEWLIFDTFDNRDPKTVGSFKSMITSSNCSFQIRSECNIKLESGIVENMATFCSLLLALGGKRNVIPSCELVLFIPYTFTYSQKITFYKRTPQMVRRVKNKQIILLFLTVTSENHCVLEATRWGN